MFTQFFGNYLLNEQLVSPELLSEVLQNLKNVRVKLGVLAINAGLITPEQAEEVHTEQQRTDKRMGDIMVDKGLISNNQLETLLNSQKSAHLMLGQALIDSGNMTTSQFATALNTYKSKNELTDEDFNNYDDAKIKNMLSNFYNVDTFFTTNVISYISLLLKNITRFIGDDFIPLKAEKITNYYGAFSTIQQIEGQHKTLTIIDAEENAFLEFASRFANERITKNDEYAQASVGEFLNLQNGLYCVNISDETGVENELKPQQFEFGKKLKHLENAYRLPISFAFGIINIIIIK